MNINVNCISKILVISLGAFLLFSCSSMKKGDKSATSGEQAMAQTDSVDDESGFNDKNSPNRLKAPFNQVYYFDFNKYEVQSDDVGSVNAQAQYLLSHPKAHVRIDGHTDERGSREYNVALGWKRANAVSSVLKQEGVSSKQFSVVSWGKQKPAALGHDEDSHSLNRRANLSYEAK